MVYLIAVSLIWSFSFSLFKSHLAGLDPNLMAFLRMLLALPLFAPLLRVRGVSRKQALCLAGIGAVQYGVMYAALNASYAYLQGWQVALMTIFTPLYVSLLDGLWQRRVNREHLALALLAVVGAAILKFKGAGAHVAVMGFLLVQVANVCFAFGQLAYRELRRSMPDVRDARIYALPYAGAVVVTAVTTSVSGGWGQLMGVTGVQWAVLLYMGVIASGLSFFLWNVGAARVNTGTLAVMNNLKIPLAVLVGVALFHEPADLGRLAIGGGLMILAVVIAERRAR